MPLFGEYSDGARAFAAGGDFDDVIDGGGDFDLTKSLASSQLPEMRMLRTVGLLPLMVVQSRDVLMSMKCTRPIVIASRI